jgi:hypothetical protein
MACRWIQSGVTMELILEVTPYIILQKLRDPPPHIFLAKSNTFIHNV